MGVFSICWYANMDSVLVCGNNVFLFFLVSDTDSDSKINYPKFSDIRNSDIRIFGYPVLNTPNAGLQF
ncbi:hypothetical protein HanPI659440_Chr13g0491481 [Helianthus annuus]|nr:hypothetical protein HanPI659440_Chr13g0491481 [Helianthus annuus]